MTQLSSAPAGSEALPPLSKAEGDQGPGLAEIFRPTEGADLSENTGLAGIPGRYRLTDLGRRLALLPVHPRIGAMLQAAWEQGVPDRGCLIAAVLNELAERSNVGFVLDESAIPVRPAVMAACEMLGMDPLYVANEGKIVAIVPEAHAEAVLHTMHQHPYGQDAAIIGRAVADHPGMVLAQTGIGGRRVVDMPLGEILPRIC